MSKKIAQIGDGKINYHKIRSRCWELLEPGQEKDYLSKIIDLFLLALITLNVFSVILETVDQVYYRFEIYFLFFEYFSVLFFQSNIY